MDFSSFLEPLEELRNCSFCPRNCHADRFSGRLGYCKSDGSFNISSICIHRGEEPVISGRDGICNIFFTHCNLQCIYCQNHQISNNCLDPGLNRMELEQVINEITAILDRGIRRVGFVSPSHFIPQVKIIIAVIRSLGYDPVWVYNTNGYDKSETIRSLEGLIDVYLPDCKYMEPELAKEYSDASDYPEIASKALKEMYRQKGAALHLAKDHTAESGIVIRHLVLPGHTENSKKVLRHIAEEISPALHISLMSQYYPVAGVRYHQHLKRGVSTGEYNDVVREMDVLGIIRGWIQEMESSGHYRPDFQKDHPFEDPDQKKF
jgi:putative pyruvate formate lyase activating enzyme